MSEQLNELLLDLLIKQATYGLDDEEQVRLNELQHAPDDSFLLTATAVNIAELSEIEPMPAHLRNKISEQAAQWFESAPEVQTAQTDLQPTFVFEPKRSWTSWLGWVVAAAACAALAFNIAMTRLVPDPTLVKISPTPNASQTPDLAKAHDEMLAQPSLIRAAWSPGPSSPEMAKITGDVVWSDEKQAGYLKVRGLPTNDKTKTTYQLWIFEENQGDKTPIDGGTFDIDANGDVVIPINAKLRTKNPALFAITVEKPGGVVVSKRDKIAALAKVETPAKQNA